MKQPRQSRIAATLPHVMRYAFAGVGPVGGAGAQFLLSLVLLHQWTPDAFGSFSFLLTASFFSAGVWSALFCSPMPALFASSERDDRERILRCLLSLSLVGAVLAAGMFAGIAAMLGAPLRASLIFGAYEGVFLIRWFGRAYFYAIGKPLRTTASDLLYAAVLLVGLGVIAKVDQVSTEVAYGVLLLSAAAGLAPFGATYLGRQFSSFRPGALRSYRSIWRQHSGWSFVGVLTTEATMNAHVYIVTLISGPAAYAALAATALVIRPINVAQTAITDFERARIAQMIGGADIRGALRAVVHFRRVLIAGWVISAAGAALVMAISPHLLFPERYGTPVLALGVTLWMAVAGVRLVRGPDSTLLQAAGRFRPLAQASIVSCGFSVAAVLAMLFLAGPVWTILGLLIGEFVAALCTKIQARRWIAAHAAADAGKPLGAATLEAVGG